MKVEWEAGDIVCGRRVTKGEEGEKFILGFDASEPAKTRYIMVSLRDGMMLKKEQSMKSLAAYLTEHEFFPVEVFNEAAGRELF